MIYKKEVSRIFDGGKYCIEGGEVIFRGVRMEGADAATFEHVAYFYEKDEGHVYHHGEIVPDFIPEGRLYERESEAKGAVH